LCYAAVYEGLAATFYILGDPALFDPIFRAKYIAFLPLVRLHGLASIVALALGPFQFLPRRRPWLHRGLGICYLLGVALGSTSGLVMATMAEGGLSSRTGFVVMASLWFITANLAWRSVRRHDYRAHRAWMIRNFALTFGAVMLRVYLHGLEALGFTFAQVYPLSTWLGWIPNLLVAEWLIVNPFPRGALTRLLGRHR
jgi:uncharacterized membrane protein